MFADVGTNPCTLPALLLPSAIHQPHTPTCHAHQLVTQWGPVRPVLCRRPVRLHQRRQRHGDARAPHPVHRLLCQCRGWRDGERFRPVLCCRGRRNRVHDLCPRERLPVDAVGAERVAVDAGGRGVGCAGVGCRAGLHRAAQRGHGGWLRDGIRAAGAVVQCLHGQWRCCARQRAAVHGDVHLARQRRGRG